MVKNQQIIKNAKISPQMIAIIGILMAAQAALGIFEIHTATIKISLSFIPVVIAARLYGGIGGALVAGFGDIIGCIVHPVGAWFPPITLTYAFAGFIYGLLLHKKANLVRIFIAIGITQLLISLFVTTLWTAFLSYKNDMMFFEFYLTRVGLRIWQVLIMSVVQAVIIPPMLKALDKIKLFNVSSI